MLSQVTVSLPEVASPWFFWLVSFGIFLVMVTAMFISIVKAGRYDEEKKMSRSGSFVACAVLSGLMATSSLVYSGAVFYKIFEKTMQQ